MRGYNMRSISTTKLMNLVRTTETLVQLGRPLNRALHDVSTANALTATDVAAIISLLDNSITEGSTNE